MMKSNLVLIIKNNKYFTTFYSYSSLSSKFSNFNKLNKSNYEILGINSNCTKEEVKSAYYKLAKLFHPDLNNNSLNIIKFQEIQKAYQAILIERENENTLRVENNNLVKEKELDISISKILFSNFGQKNAYNFKGEAKIKGKLIYPYLGIKLDYLDLLVLKYCYHHILYKQHKKDLKRSTLKEQNEKININHKTFPLEQVSQINDEFVFKLTKNRNEKYTSSEEFNRNNKKKLSGKEVNKQNFTDNITNIESFTSKFLSFIIKIISISGISYLIFVYYGWMTIPVSLYIFFACFF
jgi:curved DNA-binding protein CbpA